MDSEAECGSAEVEEFGCFFTHSSILGSRAYLTMLRMTGSFLSGTSGISLG